MDWVDLNRLNWDERAPAHAVSADYAVDRFIDDPVFLSRVVQYDRPRLGDIAGLRGIHLQCHIGTDTISLYRLGAAMTGLDFSPASIAEARRLAERTNSPVEFVESAVYDALEVLEPDTFDLVYTGIGALCWLPMIVPWAEVVAALLRPGGRLFMREGHPMLWALDEHREEALVIRYPYFEVGEPLVSDEGGTYVETDRVFTHTVTHEWNHGIGEVVTALLGAGMELTALVEDTTVPWLALPGQMSADARGEYRLDEQPDRLAASYTLEARKR